MSRVEAGERDEGQNGTAQEGSKARGSTQEIRQPPATATPPEGRRGRKPKSWEEGRKNSRSEEELKGSRREEEEERAGEEEKQRREGTRATGKPGAERT